MSHTTRHHVEPLPTYIADGDLTYTEPLLLGEAERTDFMRYSEEQVFPRIRALSDALQHQKAKTYIDRTPQSKSLFIARVQLHERNDPLLDGTMRLGTIATSMAVVHNNSSVTLYALEDGGIACRSDHAAGNARLLDSPTALFEPLPRRIYAPGNPALWIARLAQRQTLETIHADLTSIPRP